MNRIDSETKLHLAFIPVFIVAGLLFFWHVRTYKPRVNLSAFSTAPLEPSYDWGSHHLTLVIAERDGCPYCEASRPFYSSLLNLERTSAIKAHVIFLLPNDNREIVPDQAREDQIFTGDMERFGIKGTPTVLLVDESREIHAAWLGQLSARQEELLISAVH